MHKSKTNFCYSEALDEIASQMTSAISECIQSSANLLEKQQALKRIQTRQSAAIAQEDYEQGTVYT